MELDVRNTGKEYVLLKAYKFEGGTVPKGFDSDGASIPALAMRFFSHTDIIKMQPASVVHDYLCRNRIGECRAVNELFRKMCKEAGLGNKWYTSWKLPLVFWSCYIWLKYVEGWK